MGPDDEKIATRRRGRVEERARSKWEWPKNPIRLERRSETESGTGDPEYSVESDEIGTVLRTDKTDQPATKLSAIGGTNIRASPIV